MKIANKIDTGLICLSIVADSLGVKLDKSKLPKEASPHAILDESSLIKIAGFFKINLEVSNTEPEALPEYPSPSIAVLKNGNFAVIGRCDGKRAVVFDPVINKPKVVKNEDTEVETVTP